MGSRKALSAEQLDKTTVSLPILTSCIAPAQ